MIAPELSERELEVLRGMAAGKTNGEIGRELYLSEDTVKTHGRRLFTLLGAATRGQAVSLGYQLGVLTVGQQPEAARDASRIVLRATSKDAARLAAALFPDTTNTKAAQAIALGALRRMVGAS